MVEAQSWYELGQGHHKAATHCHQAPFVASGTKCQTRAGGAHTHAITQNTTMDTYPGSELSISQLLHALEGKLDQLVKISTRYDL